MRNIVPHADCLAGVVRRVPSVSTAAECLLISLLCCLPLAAAQSWEMVPQGVTDFYFPVVSPDGQLIAGYSFAGNALTIMNREGVVLQSVAIDCPGETSRPTSLRFSPNSRRVLWFFMHPHAVVCIYDLTTRKTSSFAIERDLEGDLAAVWNAEFLGDSGDVVLRGTVSTEKDTKAIQVWSADGEKKHVFEGKYETLAVSPDGACIAARRMTSRQGQLVLLSPEGIELASVSVPVRIAGSESIRFSPSGSSFLWVWGNGEEQGYYLASIDGQILAHSRQKEHLWGCDPCFAGDDSSWILSCYDATGTPQYYAEVHDRNGKIAELPRSINRLSVVTDPLTGGFLDLSRSDEIVHISSSGANIGRWGRPTMKERFGPLQPQPYSEQSLVLLASSGVDDNGQFSLSTMQLAFDGCAVNPLDLHLPPNINFPMAKDMSRFSVRISPIGVPAFDMKSMIVDSCGVKICEYSGPYLAMSDDGKRMLGGELSRDYKTLGIDVWDEERRQWRRLEGKTWAGGNLLVSGNGAWGTYGCATRSHPGTSKAIALVDMTRQSVVERLKYTDADIWSLDPLAISPSGNWVLASAFVAEADAEELKRPLVLWSRQSRNWQVIGSGVVGRGVAFSDDERLVAYHSSGRLAVYDLVRDQNSLFEVSGSYGSIFFCRGGELVVVSTSGQGLTLVNRRTRQMASLICDAHDWLLYTDDGYFDASRRGARFVAMVRGLDAYSIDQFALRNNRPDIIMERLGLGTPELIAHMKNLYQKRLRSAGMTEAQLSGDLHVPEVKITEVQRNGKKATVTCVLRDSKLPVARYNIYVNNVPLMGASGKAIVPKQSALLKKEIELTSGVNRIEVSCVNSAGAESHRAYTQVDCEVPAKGDLYYVGFGVSEYSDKSLSLRYADKDAADLADAMKKVCAGHYGAVHTRVFTNSEATVVSVGVAREFLDKATVDDTLILFIAGHGVHDRDKASTYYFLTHDTDLKQLEDTAVPFELFEQLLEEVKPRRKVFLMDTCESGELEERTRDEFVALASSRGLRGRSIRGLKVASPGKGSGALPSRSYLLDRNRYIYDDLKRRTGSIVLSSCMGNELSYESDQFENGLFTEAILRGLGDAGTDADRNGEISEQELRDYVVKTVESMSKGVQHPTVDRDNTYVDIPVARTAGSGTPLK